MKTVIEMILESGMHPELPSNLEPAIKLTNPDWTTHGGFSWYQPSKKWIVSDTVFNPTTCIVGGLHVANTIAAAQSGGATLRNCLWVGVDPTRSGPWQNGKRKARRVFVGGPIDLIKIIRTFGNEADLSRANLYGANLSGVYLSEANLSGANLNGANLNGAYLSEANLSRADLNRANLYGANLNRADLSRADLRGADLSRADLSRADLYGANLNRADLSGANLNGAYLSEAHLRGADLSRADLNEADLRGAIGYKLK